MSSGNDGDGQDDKGHHCHTTHYLQGLRPGGGAGTVLHGGRTFTYYMTMDQRNIPNT